MPEPNVLPVREVARMKGCTPEAIYFALDRGELNGTRVGRTRLVYRDGTLEAWTVRETGGRRHESYKKKHGTPSQD